MKIAIFTRTGFHHTSFINMLQERFDVACVVREAYPEGKRETVASAARKFFIKDGLKKIRDERYLREFLAKNSSGFRYHQGLKDLLKAPFDVVLEKTGTQYLHLNCGDINSSEFAEYLEGLKPDIIATLGSSVIKPHIIAIPSTAMINLHSGLSPYYRGTWSYGWPIVNNEPEYIGVTVHHIHPGIDTGDIIFQTRPVLEKNDDLNTIFLKVISEGIELVTRTIQKIIETGAIESYKQPENTGRHYTTRDLTTEAARTCTLHLEGGIIDKYNANKMELDAKLELYGYIPPLIFK